jgi:hypothetical protein
MFQIIAARLLPGCEIKSPAFVVGQSAQTAVLEAVAFSLVLSDARL